MKPFRYFRALLPALALALAGLTAAAPASAQLLETIQKRGTLRVGMSTFVPWAMRDKEGNLVGFEIDVAKQVAADMDVEIEFVPTAWSGIIPALLADKFDLIIGGMSITPQRNLTVNFTIPYAHSGQQMAANTELTKGFDSLEDYNDAAVSIACRRGATPCNLAEKVFPKATLLRFDDDNQAYQEVLNGNAHAVIASAPKPGYIVEENPEKVYLANSGENLTRGDEAFALRKGDADALNFFSNWILTKTSDGWLQERHDYWFKQQSSWKDTIASDQ